MIGRLSRTLVRDVKRGLCLRGLGEYTFDVEEFGRYRFRCANAIEYYRAVQYGGEAAALGAFLFLLRADDVVWDVGASVGLFTVHAAGVASRVVAFEPDPATCARLRQHVELNALTDRVECRMEALGDRAGRVSLRTDGTAGAAPSMADLGRHSGATDAVVATIDDLISDGITPPTVVKIDVEGAEALVLHGGRRLLASSNGPRLVFLEAHPTFLPAFGSSVSAVDALLAEYGFRIAVRRQRDDQVHLLAMRG